MRRNSGHSFLFSFPSQLVLTFGVLIVSQNCLAQAGNSSQTTKTSTPSNPMAPQSTAANAKTLNSTTKSTTSTNSNNATQSVKTQQVVDASVKPFSISAQLSRSRNLVDFKDGSRSDSIEVLVLPSYKTANGGVSLRLGYAQDLNDPENIANGMTDAVVGFSLLPTVWKHTSTSTSLGFSISGILPTSKVSQKQTQLKGALSTSMSLGLKTNPETYGQFNVGISVSAGRSFHAFEEDVNGSVLSQYSSNQILSAGYSISDFSMSFEFWNRSRWTYQNNVRQSFIMSQELGYGINPNFSIAIGHTNEGSALKANGQDSNIGLFNEDTSTIYGSLGVSY